ncbi:DEAD/DEAH box helicase [Paracoccaceae bacterium]|nr:DEAD/DEAH box helicase [Paracoccaceae bacterium]
MLKLKNVPEELESALNEKGYDKLTTVQSLVLNPSNSGKDLLVSSQTGSGKTLAYGLSISSGGLKEIIDEGNKLITLIVTPTRELALQVFNELAWLFSKTSITISTAIGGMDIKKERKNIAKGVNLLIGTPGRINDHIRRKNFDLSNLKSLVLDEADEMLDLGFKQDLDIIVNQSPKGKRILMFSATIPKKILSLASRYQKDAVRIEATSLGKAHTDISYETYMIKKYDIENAIFNFLRFHDDKTIIIFCSTRNAVTHISSRILNRGFSVVSLSGALNQSERFKALQSIKNGRCKICVATDVAARGIDLVNLDIVIHAELPQNSEILIHRSGRTGRAGNKGRSILFCSPGERRRYERLVNSAKVTPVLNKFLSQEEIERKDNEKIINYLSKSKKTSSSELKLANELLTQFSSEDIAVALIENFKGKLPPIEEVESFDEEKVNQMASNQRKKKRGGKRKRGPFSKKKQRP